MPSRIYRIWIPHILTSREHDIETANVLLSLGWVFWVSPFFWEYHRTAAVVRIMLTVASEWAWGGVFFLNALFTFFSIIHYQTRYRLYACYFSLTLWLMLTVLFWMNEPKTLGMVVCPVMVYEMVTLSTWLTTRKATEEHILKDGEAHADTG